MSLVVTIGPPTALSFSPPFKRLEWITLGLGQLVCTASVSSSTASKFGHQVWFALGLWRVTRGGKNGLLKIDPAQPS